MNDMNVLAINGRLVRDAELSYTNGGMAIGKFSIASNRSVKKNDKWEDEAGFYDCVMFGKMAQSVNQYLTKGQQVSIAGEIRQERWEKDGQARSKIVIIVNHLQLMGGKSEPKEENRYPRQQSGPESFADDSSDMNLKEENARMKAMNNHLVTNGDLAFCEMTEGKVIGNIHDNHELLS